MYLSFEDFMMQRAANNITSNGDLNPWAANPVKMWREGNFSSPTIGKHFTASMAKNVKKKMATKVRREGTRFQRVV